MSAAPEVPIRTWAGPDGSPLLGLLLAAGGGVLVVVGTAMHPAHADPAAAPRVGGCAHKVIRWAFEAQGMYPERPGELREAPGLPPCVDIYIKDRRPETETLGSATVTHGPGAYVPVSLDWGRVGDRSPGGESPGWFAHDGAIRQTNGGVEVTVANRGAEVAHGVVVDVWPVERSRLPAWHNRIRRCFQ